MNISKRILVSMLFGAALSISVPSVSFAKSGICNPVEVMVFPSRIHVRCEAPLDGFIYFAAPTSDTEHTNRLLTILSAAQLSGRSLIVHYFPNDLSGADFGCLNGNCRKLVSAGFGAP